MVSWLVIPSCLVPAEPVLSAGTAWELFSHPGCCPNNSVMLSSYNYNCLHFLLRKPWAKSQIEFPWRINCSFVTECMLSSKLSPAELLIALTQVGEWFLLLIHISLCTATSVSSWWRWQSQFKYFLSSSFNTWKSFFKFLIPPPSPHPFLCWRGRDCNGRGFSFLFFTLVTSVSLRVQHLC